VLSTQLVALNEILELSITDPVIRFILKEFDIYRLSPEYSEPDLIISTSKALGSLENAYVHDIWSSVISSHGHRIFANETSFNLVLNTLRDSETSYLAARYIIHILNTMLKDGANVEDKVFRLFQSLIWNCYILVAIQSPQNIEWQNMKWCLQNINLGRENVFQLSSRIKEVENASKQQRRRYPEFFVLYFDVDADDLKNWVPFRT